MTRIDLLLWLDFIFRSFFFGFVMWTIYWVFTSRKILYGNTLEDVDKFLVRMIIFFGIYHIVSIGFGLIDFAEGLKINALLIGRATGPYWFAFWTYPITYFGLTQLFWLPQFRKNKVVRLIVAIAIFCVMHFEKFLILATSLHRDYLGELGYGFVFRMIASLILSWLTSTIFFGVFLFVMLRLRRSLTSVESR
jgi:hypothetical protein